MSRAGEVSKPFKDLLNFCDAIGFDSTEHENLSFACFRLCVLNDLPVPFCRCGVKSQYGKRKDNSFYVKNCSIKCRGLDIAHAENISKRKQEQYSDPTVKLGIENKKKHTNRSKLGVDHPMQDAKTFDKHFKGCFKNKGKSLQGYEPISLDLLSNLYPDIIRGVDFIKNNSKITWADAEGKQRTSFPDFYSELFGGFIEIKSIYTRKIGEYKLMKCRDALHIQRKAYCIITVVPKRNRVSFIVENFNTEFINDY